MPKDWYKLCNELEPGQVFRAYDDSIVMLDRRVPGDGTKWYVAEWDHGWFFMDATIEPGELEERLPEANYPFN